jgi:protein required for attachment to host cells
MRWVPRSGWHDVTGIDAGPAPPAGSVSRCVRSDTPARPLTGMWRVAVSPEQPWNRDAHRQGAGINEEEEMVKTWVLVADSCRARIFVADAATGPLREVETLAHPEGRLHEQHMTSDRPGRTFDRYGQGRHAMSAGNEPKHQEAIGFAKRVSAHIEERRKEGAFDRLVIVAAPAFLGLLRQEFSDPTTGMLALEINKDLTQLNAEQIRAHLPENLTWARA